MATIRSVFSLSRWLHKYVGLALLLVFFFLSVTGILINHPSLLSSWSVPTSWLGKSYQYSNWNRFSFRDSIVLDDGVMVVGGKMGVWASSGPGAAFHALNAGLPGSFYLRDINTLLAVDYQGTRRLFAGGRSGLFYRNEEGKAWLPVKGLGAVEVVDLVQTKEQIMAFSPHACFVATVSQGRPVFTEQHMQMDTDGQWIPGFRVLFELHSGKLFGLPGRLVADVVALLLIFLCISAVYLWYVPWRERQRTEHRGKKHWYARFYAYHLSVGVWVALFLFIIAGSGIFIRPPLILLSSMVPVPFAVLAGKTPEILRAAISGESVLVLATRDGWYRGNTDFSLPLQAIIPPVPVFGMGATVLESLGDQQLLVGSFSGLYKWNVGNNTGVDLDGNPAPKKAGLMPGEVMAAAAIICDGSFIGYADYKKGLRNIKNIPIMDRPFPVKQLESRTSLYHFLFELHNGRFLRDVMGPWYILYVPLAGMALMLVVCTGIFDWLKRKKSMFVVAQKDRK